MEVYTFGSACVASRKKKVVVIASWGRCAFALCLGVRVALAVPTSGVQFLWTPPARATTPSTNLNGFFVAWLYLS